LSGFRFYRAVAELRLKGKKTLNLSEKTPNLPRSEKLKVFCGLVRELCLERSYKNVSVTQIVLYGAFEF
jgi:hypothetical protein